MESRHDGGNSQIATEHVCMMQPITITAAAAKAILEKAAMKEGALGLRLTIKTTGCSGNSYAMDFAMPEVVAGDDRIDGPNGAAIYIPKTQSWMLFGMTIDYTQNDMSSGFTFTNPNETGRCGCGESFSVG